MIEDSELLRQFVVEGSQDAFAELVRRRINLVYGIALRQTRGDVEMAKDVVQTVFVTLARKANSLYRHEVIAGWLCRCAELASRDRMRAERRRTNREQKAHAMNQLIEDRQADEWGALRPELDRVLSDLNEVDRNAIVLRFFDQQSFGEIGARLKLTENAARMRVERGLERMHALLARQGITSTAVAMSSALAYGSSVAAPAGLAATVSTAAVTGAAMSTSLAIQLFPIMSTSKTIAAIAGAVALGSFTYSLYLSRAADSSAQETAQARAESEALRQQLAHEKNSTLKLLGEVDALKRQVTSTASAPGNAPTPISPPPSAVVYPYGYALGNADARKLLLQQHALRAKSSFALFFASAGLSTQQQDEFLRVVMEGADARLDRLAGDRVGYAGTLADANVYRQKGALLDQQASEETQAAMRAVLGDAVYQQYRDYKNTVVEREVAEQLAGKLYHTTDPLTAQQADRLIQVLAQEKAKRGVPLVMNGTTINEQTFRTATNLLHQRLDWTIGIAPVSDAAVSRAQAILTPTQITALQQLQLEQAIQMKLLPAQIAQPSSKAGGG